MSAVTVFLSVFLVLELYRNQKSIPIMISAQPGSDERTAKATLPKPAPYLWPDTLHLN